MTITYAQTSSWEFAVCVIMLCNASKSQLRGMRSVVHPAKVSVGPRARQVLLKKMLGGIKASWLGFVLRPM